MFFGLKVFVCYRFTSSFVFCLWRIKESLGFDCTPMENFFICRDGYVYVAVC